ncbi:unnamed protein product, partial [Adineta steineri]
MKNKIQDPSFRENLIAYLEDIIKEDLDEFKDKYVFENLDAPRSFNTPTQLSSDNIYAALRTIDLAGLEENTNENGIRLTPMKDQSSPSIPYASPQRTELLQTTIRDQSISNMDASDIQSRLPTACLPTPNPSLPNFWSQFCADVIQLVESGNVHIHSDTCYKYCKDMAKKTCRLIMPRKLISVSSIDPETGHISMRRSHPWINNFNEYIISACRSNMDIKFIWTGSDAKALVYYITDYITKTSLSFHDTFSLIQKSITSFRNVADQTETESAIERSRKLVLRCYSTLASQQELSGVQVASYLMNWGDHYTTHKFQGLYLIQTEIFLQTELNELRIKQNLEHASHDVIDDDNVFDDENTAAEDDNEENFQIPSTENKNNFVLVNTRVDYQYRSDILSKICLYDFVSTFYKRKMNATDAKYLSKSSTTEDQQGIRKGRPPNQRFSFQEQHPQATTYLLTEYSEAHIPILYGPQIPRHDREDTKERYSRALLTLFVPWRSVSDLCDVNENWEDALKSRQHHISADSWNIIENIQLLHECKKDRDEHLLQVITEAQTENDTIDPELVIPSRNRRDEYDDTSDNEDLLELLGNLNEYTTNALNSTKKTTENIYIEETIEAVEKVGRFTHIQSTNNGQLIMCIPGCGGTGKSQLIRAVTKYFLVTKRIQMMRKLAPTGIAAAEIGGMTIHSFLGEQRNSGKPRTIKPGDSKLEKQWALVEYLLIDEMSMVGLTLLAKLNRILSAAKHADPQIPFGGINVIFFGDYLQYRPVYDEPLYTDFSQPSKNKSGQSRSEKEIQQRAARSLILQINCVIKLSQQMRTEDERYRELLERLRQGDCTLGDYELLLTRVVGQPSVSSLRESPWNEAPILAYRNEVRTQLNNKAAVHNAAQLGHQLMVCVAQDTCRGKAIEDPILMKKLLELSDSKTEHLPGLLPFVPGMPVILTQNLAIELGLINGINEIFRQLVYEADSVSIDALSNTFPSNTQYVHRPLYALIEIARSKIECNLETLQPKIVPVPLMEQTFRFDVTDILPKNKKPKSNQKAMLSIERRARPLVPAYCITTHKSQGQTLSKAVIDLKLPNETE